MLFNSNIISDLPCFREIAYSISYVYRLFRLCVCTILLGCRYYPTSALSGAAFGEKVSGEAEGTTQCCIRFIL